MLLRSIFASPVLIALAACNPIANLDEAEKRVETFQQTYNQADPDALYRMTGEQFRAISSRDDFQAIYDVIEARLGPIESSERVNFNINSNNGVTTTVVAMETAFELGDGIETYTFVGHGEDIELAGWQVNSPRLTITAEDLSKLGSEEGEAEQADAPQ